MATTKSTKKRAKKPLIQNIPLNMRVSESWITLVEAAAKIEKTDKSKFIREVLEAEAKKVIRAHNKAKRKK